MAHLRHLENKYEILEKRQVGGQGESYKVRHRLLNELRLVWVIPPPRGESGLGPRFQSEVSAAIQSSHANIARVFDCTVDEDGVAYLETEQISGLTLAELLTVAEVPPLELSLEIGRQGLSALGHLHQHQLFARDVSPANLKLTTDEAGQPRVKWIDLGLGRPPKEDPSSVAPEGTLVAGLRYAAPEAFEDQASEDPRRSDLYAFGLVLYELLTGRFPISGESTSSLIAGHLFRPPLDFAVSDPEGRVPEPIRSAVLKALAKSPEERFADAESFAAQLQVDQLSTEETDAAVDLSNPEVQQVLRLVAASVEEPATPIEATPTEEPATPIEATPTEEPATPIEATPTPAEEPSAAPPEAAIEAPSPSSLDSDMMPTRILRTHPRPKAEPPVDPETENLPPASPVAAAETIRLDRDQVLAMQADELTARAQRRAQAGDLAQATELVQEALQLVPDHGPAQAFLSEIQQDIAGSNPRGAEESGVETVTNVDEVLATEPETERLDDPEVMQALRREAAATQERVDGDSTTMIRDSVTLPEPDPASGSLALEESLRNIRTLQEGGQIGEALKQLNQAVREYGPQPTLRILRDELGEALLEQDSEQEESASQIFDSQTFDVRPSSGTAPTELSARPPQDPPPGSPPPSPPKGSPPNVGRSSSEPPAAAPQPGAAPIRGLSDATIRSIEPGIRPTQDRPGPPTAHPTRNMVMVGLILAVVFAALVFFLTRQGSTEEPRPLEAEDVDAADLSPGSLVLDAVPWAEIVSLENPAAEETPPISPSRFTPVVLQLPPGEYWVTLRYPPTGQIEERVVQIDSDARVEERIVFESLNAEAYFERIRY